MSNEIQRADPNARKRARKILVVGTAVGLLMLLGLEELRSRVMALARVDPVAAVEQFRLLLLAASVLLVGGLLAIAAYLWQYASRTLAAIRYPPPGVPVVRDTVVLTGDAAERRGRALRIIAVVVLVVGAAISLWIWRLLRLVGAGIG